MRMCTCPHVCECVCACMYMSILVCVCTVHLLLAPGTIFEASTATAGVMHLKDVLGCVRWMSEGLREMHFACATCKQP
jgi:hypothetical protein